MARLPAALLLAAAPALAGSLDDVFVRLYNFDFAGAHRLLDAHLATQPDDPFAHTARAAAYLFSELDRLRILEAEFLADDRKISGDDKLAPDPEVRERLFASIARAQETAEARLRDRPGDTLALFSFCLTEGIRTDYMAFVEKRQLRSLFSARKSQQYAVELLRRDPDFADAHLTTGISEYLVGSLPFFIRWFIRFDQVKGSKQQAVANLEKVAASGRYMGPFARILLAIIHIREKREPKARALLEGLTQQFPENPLLRREFAKLRAKQSGAK